MEKRKFMRFLTSLKVEAKREGSVSFLGLIRDFSREGLRAVFESFEFSPNASIDLKIQRPNEDILIPASGEVVWKRPIGGKWEVGLRLKEFLPRVKAEILEHGYNEWLRNTLNSPRNNG